MKNRLYYVLCFWLLAFDVLAEDGTILADKVAQFWRPVIGIGGGIGTTHHFGEVKTFPIQNPVVDEFYSYSPRHETQTSGLFEVFAGAEQRFYQDRSVQYGLAYEQVGTYDAHGVFIQGADLTSANQYTYQYHVMGRTLLAQAKWMVNYHHIFYPYVLVGIGAAYNSASAYATNTPPFLTFTREYKANDTYTFAYRVGLGIDMELTQHSRLGVAYRFADLGQVSLGAANIDSIRVSGTLSQSHFYLNEMLIQYMYLF